MAQFVDTAVLYATAGNGGHGCASVHREKFKPLGGPDGGNGGSGGDVALLSDPAVTTLLDYQYAPHRKAGHGGPGMGGHRNGADGEGLELRVPVGTVVRYRSGPQAGELIADLDQPGRRVVIAAGGRGGLGNSAIASPRRKAPGFALKGEPGEDVEVSLELKSVADIALVGFPSAGKSSLIAVVSAARPKIADYPFTTLIPNLGVVDAGSTRFTIADVPGLIPGASSGRGLGLDFLRHVERCAAIVHVLDCATLESDRDPISDLDALLRELEAYPVTTFSGTEATPLTARPRLVALNKVDSPDAEEMARMVRPELERRGYQVYEISTVTRHGLKELTFAMAALVAEHRASLSAPVEVRTIVRPRAVDDAGFAVAQEPDPDSPNGVLFRVTGAKPVRWVAQTDFANDEAVGYLADRLARLGVEDALYKAGAVAGATVVIGPGDDTVVFEWEPTMAAGAELLASPRGTDLRLIENQRPTRAEKREEFTARMDAKAAARDELAAERERGVWASDDAANGPAEDA